MRVPNSFEHQRAAHGARHANGQRWLHLANEDVVSQAQIARNVPPSKQAALRRLSRQPSPEKNSTENKKHEPQNQGRVPSKDLLPETPLKASAPEHDSAASRSNKEVASGDDLRQSPEEPQNLFNLVGFRYPKCSEPETLNPLNKKGP